MYKRQFQRHDVWKQRQKSELIESILMGIPIPLMYLFEDKNGKKQVVDGRQRISAILDFLEGKFKLNNLRILKQFNGCCFADLDLKQQGVIEDFQLLFYIPLFLTLSFSFGLLISLLAHFLYCPLCLLCLFFYLMNPLLNLRSVRNRRQLF